jgi:hypothetical protein
MQTLVQVVCKRGPSLREAIANYKKIHKFNLEVTLQKRPGRKHGWMKMHSTRKNRRGAMNLEWNANTNILIGRVITRGKNKPNRLISDFVDFLFGSKFKGRVKAIHIIPG